MFNLAAGACHPSLVDLFDLKNTILLLCSATTLILPSGSMDADLQLVQRRWLSAVAGLVLFMVLLPWCVAIMASGSLNPFIYYRF
jgi:type IV secretory pathway TrbD component